MDDKKMLMEFHEAMLEIYRRAQSEAGYPATRFLSMVSRDGGYETARYLIHSPKVSDGYTALWELKRLDLTVEAVIVENPKWHALFTANEIEICRKRLADYGRPTDRLA
jgi:hypothetical protein